MGRLTIATLLCAVGIYAQSSGPALVTVDKDVAGTTTKMVLPDNTQVKVQTYPGRFGTTWVTVTPPPVMWSPAPKAAPAPAPTPAKSYGWEPVRLSKDPLEGCSFCDVFKKTAPPQKSSLSDWLAEK